jgi:hypothetical protein
MEIGSPGGRFLFACRVGRFENGISKRIAAKAFAAKVGTGCAWRAKGGREATKMRPIKN